jgi:hypothetical protein
MATERLIELLKTLETETAIAAVAEIVRRFGDANWLPAAERKKAARSRRGGRAVVPSLCFWRWRLLLQQHVHAHGKTQYEVGINSAATPAPPSIPTAKTNTAVMALTSRRRLCLLDIASSLIVIPSADCPIHNVPIVTLCMKQITFRTMILRCSTENWGSTSGRCSQVGAAEGKPDRTRSPHAGPRQRPQQPLRAGPITKAPGSAGGRTGPRPGYRFGLSQFTGPFLSSSRIGVSRAPTFAIAAERWMRALSLRGTDPCPEVPFVRAGLRATFHWWGLTPIGP